MTHPSIHATLSVLGLSDAQQRALIRSIRLDDDFIRLIVYTDGWTSRLKARSAKGRATVVDISGCGYSMRNGSYSRRASGGCGPKWLCLVRSGSYWTWRRVALHTHSPWREAN